MSPTRGRSRPRRSPAPRQKHTLDARRDTPDLRDLMYLPTLVEVPTEIPLRDYRRHRVPILDQGQQGACTGYGLATVVHYLLRRRRHVPDRRQVSPHMLYRMARRYDEWPGEEDAGSSARGAMKGWHKHGVCKLGLWSTAGSGKSTELLTHERALDALDRPMGAYFRVNHRDLVAMHAALAETGILFATASCHGGWDRVGRDGIIHYQPGDEGGHAFAIVAYDRTGFWIQNSWGSGWGRAGFGRISYRDWLENGTDVWAARLGAPVEAAAALGVARAARSAASVKSPISLAEIRPHVIGIGNDGVLRAGGLIGTDRAAVTGLFRRGGDFDAVTARWPVKRLLLYAHGGLNDEEGALQRVQDYRQALIDHQVYPVAFIWKTDYWTTLRNALEDAKRRRRPEGFIEAAKNFLLDRLDDALEPIARLGTGKLEWDEMKENARLATRSRDGGARYAAGEIAKLMRRDRKVELHVAGHSAGSILLGPLVRLLTARGRVFGADGHGLALKTVTLWAPACTIEFFRECYEPAIRSGAAGEFALFTLTRQAEEDDHCANIYHKSLLYLVSHAFEERMRIPGVPGERFAGEPLLGMQRWVERDARLLRLLKEPRCGWVLAPNTEPAGSPRASTARHHGAFDDDQPTLQATLARILGVPVVPTAGAEFRFEHSAATWVERRAAPMRG